jgi:hypothetical protein
MNEADGVGPGVGVTLVAAVEFVVSGDNGGDMRIDWLELDTVDWFDCSGRSSGGSSVLGGSGDGLNKLAIPDTIMPGCRPRKGESRDMVPRM